MKSGRPFKRVTFFWLRGVRTMPVGVRSMGKWLLSRLAEAPDRTIDR